MAAPNRSDATPQGPKIDRAYLLRILELPLEEFRAARASRSPAEREQLNRLWQEEIAESVADYNRYVEEHGLVLEKYRTF